MSKISEGTEVTLDLKTIATVIAFIISLVGMYYALKADIEVAKELPAPTISRTEYDLKDQMIRDAVMNTQKQVEEIHKDVKVIDERLFEIQKGRKR
jgi:polysaccharide pyruvyl transferase WcaK-like protein